MPPTLNDMTKQDLIDQERVLLQADVAEETLIDWMLQTGRHMSSDISGTNIYDMLSMIRAKREHFQEFSKKNLNKTILRSSIDGDFTIYDLAMREKEFDLFGKLNDMQNDIKQHEISDNVSLSPDELDFVQEMTELCRDQPSQDSLSVDQDDIIDFSKYHILDILNM